MLAAIRRACIIRPVAAREESVHSAPHRQRLRLGMITDDAELEAAQKAQTVIIALSPSTPSGETVVSQMRNGAHSPRRPRSMLFERGGADNVRAEAGLALIGVIGAGGRFADRRRSISAQDAVAWIGKLVAR